ncbi:hypothetical protein ACFW6R_29730 [Streptomyces albidoflavus]|uniref:hypothetical protein n=1 Tax=Streptomyces albidoflavus TaxID=1886 RepID=UPI00332F5DED
MIKPLYPTPLAYAEPCDDCGAEAGEPCAPHCPAEAIEDAEAAEADGYGIESDLYDFPVWD